MFKVLEFSGPVVNRNSSFSRMLGMLIGSSPERKVHFVGIEGSEEGMNKGSPRTIPYSRPLKPDAELIVWQDGSTQQQ